MLRAIDDSLTVRAFSCAIDAVVWAIRHLAELVSGDYLIPNMGGIAFAMRLRGLPVFAHMPIVTVTAHEDRNVLYAALDAGITDFLAKPLDARRVLGACRKLLTLRRQKLALEARQRSLEEMAAATTRRRGLHERELLRWLQSAEAFRDSETANRLVREVR